MGTTWHSYPKIYALGHRAIAELLFDPVLVEEKIDGSQISFARYGGTLLMRSRNQEMNPDAPEKLFARAAEVIRELASRLHDGWVYRAEYLAQPRHHTLSYQRVPAQHVIVFDINDGDESYLTHDAKAEESARLGLEVVPCLHSGMVTDTCLFRDLLSRTSVLGGQTIEGVVVKNYCRFGPDKKALMGKYVSEAFKETHRTSWKRTNPTSGDIIERLADTYRTPARWRKAVQHLRERGELQGAPQDIGPLIREATQDINAECGDEIRDALWRWAWPKLARRVTAGLPEWYKGELLAGQPVLETNGEAGEP